MQKIAILVVSMLFLPFVVGAVPFGDPGGTYDLVNPLQCPDFQCVLGAIAKFIYWISLPLLTIMILWAAFQLLTAGGNEERARTAMKTLTYAGIGFMILLIAGGIPFIIKEILQ